MAKKINYDDWSKDELIKEITRIKETTYGLVWHRDLPAEKIDVLINPDARTPSELFPNEMAGKPFPVLKEVSSKAVDTKGAEQTNLLIEGDNYHSLAVLNFTHQAAVDLIYIDPPYNTGERDFRYNDRFVDKDDPFRHSKWISFMEKRLKLAKNLLKSTGAIFISIDDHEQAPLRMLCDEIFGEDNFYGCLTWIKRTKSTNSGKAKKMLQQKAEYILVYGAATAQAFQGFRLLYNGKKKEYPHDGKHGKCRFENLEATDYGRKKRDTMKFQILGVAPRPGRRWQIGKETADQLVTDGKIELVNGIPMRAVYPEDEDDESFIPFWSHLDNTGTAETGKQELSDIVGPDHGFDTVKPLPLLKQLIQRFPDDAVVLDFFAGSGTTGQAVLALNKENGGSNRRFILCTNNENDICDDVCYPRVKKVIKGYANTKGEKVDGLGGNLKYYTCDFVEAEPSDKNKRKLVNESTDMLCIREAAFDLVKEGEDFKIFKNTDKYLGIVFHEDAIDDYKKVIKKIDGHFNTYVFSLGDEPHEREFADVKDKVTLCAIPDVILKVYREIFK